MIGILSVTYKESFQDTEIFKFAKHTTYLKNICFFNFYNGAKDDAIIDSELFFEVQSKLNGGLSAGFNAGIDYMKSKPISYILFLNSDCIINDGILCKYLIGMDKSYDFIYPNLYYNVRKISPFNLLTKSYPFYIISWLAIKVEKIEKLSFPNKYWLDGIDYWLSEWIFKEQLIGLNLNTNISHNLSIASLYKETPDWRIVNIYVALRNFLGVNSLFDFIRGILKALFYRRYKLAFNLFKVYFIKL